MSIRLYKIFCVYYSTSPFIIIIIIFIQSCFIERFDVKCIHKVFNASYKWVKSFSLNWMKFLQQSHFLRRKSLPDFLFFLGFEICDVHDWSQPLVAAADHELVVVLQMSISPTTLEVTCSIKVRPFCSLEKLLSFEENGLAFGNMWSTVKLVKSGPGLSTTWMREWEGAGEGSRAGRRVGRLRGVLVVIHFRHLKRLKVKPLEQLRYCITINFWSIFLSRDISNIVITH